MDDSKKGVTFPPLTDVSTIGITDKVKKAKAGIERTESAAILSQDQFIDISTIGITQATRTPRVETTMSNDIEKPSIENDYGLDKPSRRLIKGSVIRD